MSTAAKTNTGEFFNNSEQQEMRHLLPENQADQAEELLAQMGAIAAETDGKLITEDETGIHALTPEDFEGIVPNSDKAIENLLRFNLLYESSTPCKCLALTGWNESREKGEPVLHSRIIPFEF